MLDTRKLLSGCGGQGGKRVNRPRKDERIDRSKLKRMGMMGEWMEWNIARRNDEPPSSLCDPKWVQRVGFAEMARNLVPLLIHNTRRGRGVVLGVPGLD
jgi:hypothetical protein